MNRKRVLIVSYYYPPENTPRAFRTFELVNEFNKRNFYVDVCVPSSASGNHENLTNCRFLYVGAAKSEKNSNKKGFTISSNPKLNIFKNGIKKILRYLVGGDPRAVLYQRKLLRELLNNCQYDYDLIISIGLPFYIHFGTAKFISKTGQSGVKVCDYGDPFYLNPLNKKLMHLKYIEKLTVDKFTFISIPTEKSVPYYTFLKDESEIKIIPQGFDYSSVELGEYKKNNIVTFCYAGIFYREIRNPEYLLEFLSTLNVEFQFIIYTNIDDAFFQQIYNKYKNKLAEKVVVRSFISRKELIYEMSKYDFLINLENENSNQVPSKLIDYALSGRPILSMNSKTFNENIFIEFMSSNYENETKINLEDYDIRKIVDQFQELMLKQNAIN